MDRTRHNRRRAFTLVELIVVIAVLALLAALLFPAISGARDRSLASTCSSNVRQVTMAALSFAIDNEGEMPVNYQRTGGGAHGPGFWEKILPYLPGRNLDSPRSAMNVYRCPLAKRHSWNHLGNRDPATIAYNYTPMSPNTNTAPALLSKIVQRPSAAMMLTDSSSWSTAWGGTMPGTVSAHVPPAFLHGGTITTNGGNGGGQWHYFANGKAVFGFFDGHVEMLPVTPITLGNTSTTTGRLFWAGREHW